MAVYRPSALKLTKDGTQDQYIIDLTTRVAVQQPVADAGKILGINSSGQVAPVSVQQLTISVANKNVTFSLAQGGE